MDMEIQPVPWWNRRSRMERRLIWLIGSLALVSVGLVVGLLGIIYKPELFMQNSENNNEIVESGGTQMGTLEGNAKSVPGHGLPFNELDPR